MKTKILPHSTYETNDLRITPHHLNECQPEVLEPKVSDSSKLEPLDVVGTNTQPIQLEPAIIPPRGHHSLPVSPMIQPKRLQTSPPLQFPVSRVSEKTSKAANSMYIDIIIREPYFMTSLKNYEMWSCKLCTRKLKQNGGNLKPVIIQKPFFKILEHNLIWQCRTCAEKFEVIENYNRSLVLKKFKREVLREDPVRHVVPP